MSIFAEDVNEASISLKETVYGWKRFAACMWVFVQYYSSVPLKQIQMILFFFMIMFNQRILELDRNGTPTEFNFTD